MDILNQPPSSEKCLQMRFESIHATNRDKLNYTRLTRSPIKMNKKSSSTKAANSIDLYSSSAYFNKFEFMFFNFFKSKFSYLIFSSSSSAKI